MRKRGACTNRQAVVRLYLDETGSEEKARLLDHVFHCPECRLLFFALKDLWKQEKVLSEEICSLNLNKEEIRKLQAAARSEIRKLKNRKPAGRKIRIFLKPASAVGVVLLVIASLLITLKPSRSPNIERTSRPSGFQIVEPWGKTAANSLQFQWSPVSGVRFYSLVIYDEELVPVYRKDLLRRESFTPPAEIISALKAGKLYFWKVVAHFKNNRRFESEIAKFRIILK